MRRRHLFAAIGVCALISGCRDEGWKSKTYLATGRITINGTAPEGALVQLHPIGEKVDARDSRPWGRVRADGTYTLATYETGTGAPAGTYALTVTWPVNPTIPSPADRLQSRYSRPEASKWKVTIQEGENELPPVEIVDAAVLAPGQSPKGRVIPGPSMQGVTASNGRVARRGGPKR